MPNTIERRGGTKTPYEKLLIWEAFLAFVSRIKNISTPLSLMDLHFKFVSSVFNINLTTINLLTFFFKKTAN